jgi:enoyl-CoA hydratase/carnithine racemase
MSLVTYESRERVALITIDRAEKLNALSNGVVVELRDAFLRLARDEDRCGVVTGAGERAFSVGADLRDPPRDPELWECMPGVGVDLDKPLVAAVSGFCVGGAYVLVQLCDLAVAAENAEFFYPEAQLGFSGGLIASAAARLPAKIAMELMLTGRRFDARRAYEVGMVNRVVPTGSHVEAALEYARTLAESAPLVVRTLKRFVRDHVLPRGPAELAGLARRDLLAITRSADLREGARSFLEKRKPRFEGR